MSTKATKKAAKKAENAKAMAKWKQSAQTTRCPRCTMTLYQHPGWKECESNSPGRRESKW